MNSQLIMKFNSKRASDAELKLMAHIQSGGRIFKAMGSRFAVTEISSQTVTDRLFTGHCATHMQNEYSQNITITAERVQVLK